MKRVPTDDLKAETEVRDSIGIGDRTEDDVDIEEDHKGRCVPRCFTVYNGVERKYVQVCQIAEVHGFRK